MDRTVQKVEGLKMMDEVGINKAFKNKWIRKRDYSGFCRDLIEDKIVDWTQLDLMCIKEIRGLRNGNSKGTSMAEYIKHKL
ncbi:hypothetical protein BY996DRAFT_6569533 [Phakopsora pachyrhizi]|nr:hypothetical protein BY996DRAFT_6569533 [Phakopsora pachyrhizi]